MIASLRMSRRRAATRLWPKRMPVDGFDENGEIVVPVCVRGALRPLVGQSDALRQSERSTRRSQRRPRPMRPNDFVASRGLIDPHGQVRRVARKFGLIAAAGELAIKLGVLPWEKGEALEAAEYAFKLWLDHRGTSGSLDLKQALERIRDLFEKSSDARFDLGYVSRGSERPVPNRLGWTKAAAAISAGTCCRETS
jgi:hypothetical protein